MKLTAHQPDHLPYLGFFDKISKADKFVILDNVQFKKNNFQNRNRIVTMRNGATWLTIPVDTKGHMTSSILDINVANIEWKSHYLNLLKENYHMHPHFLKYYTVIEYVINKKYDKLVQYNIELLDYLLGELEIETEVIRESELLGSESKGTKRLIELCEAVGADTYISGAGGADYMDLSLFKDAGIKVEFNEYVPKEYHQFTTKEFYPSMSVIDALMNIDSKGVIDLLKEEL